MDAIRDLPSFVPPLGNVPGYLGAAHAPLEVNDSARGLENLRAGSTDFAACLELLGQGERDFAAESALPAVTADALDRAVRLM